MMLSRRELISRAALLAAAGVTLKPSLLMAESAAAATGKNLIVINLFGGLDGLSAFPYYSGSLSSVINQELRPNLSLKAQDVLKISQQNGDSQKIGLHPAFAPLVSVASSNVKIVQSYGIPGDPGRSHDTCQTLMSLGASSLHAGDNIGFLARLMDLQEWKSFQYWAFTSENPSDTNTRKRSPVIISDVEALQTQRLWWESSGDESLATSLSENLLELEIPRDALSAQKKDALITLQSTLAVVKRDILTQSVGKNSAGDYSSYGLGTSLRDTARIIKAKRAAAEDGVYGRDSLFLLGDSGYDTHSDQVGSDGLDGLLSNLASNLAVFVKDLQLSGVFQNSIVVLYSEFGRTAFQNGRVGASSVGTDHGHGSHTIVVGGPISAGVVGEPVILSALRDREYNALKPSTDYRDIFSECFSWLGVDSTAIFDEVGYQPQQIGLIMK